MFAQQMSGHDLNYRGQVTVSSPIIDGAHLWGLRDLLFSNSIVGSLRPHTINKKE